MRELLFKNLTSQHSHRRVLFMSEVVAQDNMVIETQRRSTYLLKDCIHVKDLPNLNNIKAVKNNNKKSQRRHFSIIKKHNSKTGEDKIFCKVQGLLYIVMEDYIYLVAFTNSLKIGMRKMTFKH